MQYASSRPRSDVPLRPVRRHLPLGQHDSNVIAGAPLPLTAPSAQRLPPAPVPASSSLLVPSSLPSPYGGGSRSSAAGSTLALNPNPPAAGRSTHL